MNTNSNTYTFVYASIVVVVVAFLLAFLSGVLKEPSLVNERIDKKKKILAALNIRNVPNKEIEQKYSEIVLQDDIFNSKGELVEKGNNESKTGFVIPFKDITPEKLPLYVCKVEGQTKYVIPMRGKGLWGPIYGYLAINDDKATVFGVYFYHDSETAGLGARIVEEDFQEQFKGKELFDKATNQTALTVVKKGQVKDSTYECDGISGATLTGNGVAAMLLDNLNLYKAFLQAPNQ